VSERSTGVPAGDDHGSGGVDGSVPPTREADRVERLVPRSETDGDHIRLVLPAEPDYGRIARVAASSLALRLGLTFVEIEDLRIAVDEAIILLLRPEGTPGTITLELTVHPDRLVITATSDAPFGAPIDPAALRRFEEIIADTVDEHTVDEHRPRVQLVKRY
jgi:anti-sigma regulatory factor (Ser/Thr protein kinase)